MTSEEIISAIEEIIYVESDCNSIKSEKLAEQIYKMLEDAEVLR